MTQLPFHNPDLFMADLRQILAQGRKRIGLLIGAGAPVALKVNAHGEHDDSGHPLIPDVNRLTQTVLNDLDASDMRVVKLLLPELGGTPNIELVLTRIRRLSQAIGKAEVYGLNGADYEAMAERICQKIGRIVAPSLPRTTNPFH